MERNLLVELLLDLFKIVIFQAYIIVFKHAQWIQLPMVKEIMFIYTLIFFGIFFVSIYSPVRNAEDACSRCQSWCSLMGECVTVLPKQERQLRSGLSFLLIHIIRDTAASHLRFPASIETELAAIPLIRRAADRMPDTTSTVIVAIVLLPKYPTNCLEPLFPIGLRLCCSFQSASMNDRTSNQAAGPSVKISLREREAYSYASLSFGSWLT